MRPSAWSSGVAVVVAAVGLSWAVPARSAVTGAAPVKGQTPLLITNAGQGPGGKMVRMLVRQSKAVTDFEYNAEPTVADLQKKAYKTMLVAIGSDSKGLGASGITIDQEITRLNAMIAEARRQKIQIVAVLLEGKTRRGQPGGADERCIDAIAPFAGYLAVKRDGNADGRFDAIVKTSKAPLTLFDDALELTDIVIRMYGK